MGADRRRRVGVPSLDLGGHHHGELERGRVDLSASREGFGEHEICKRSTDGLRRVEAVSQTHQIRGEGIVGPTLHPVGRGGFGGSFHRVLLGSRETHPQGMAPAT